MALQCFHEHTKRMIRLDVPVDEEVDAALEETAVPLGRVYDRVGHLEIPTAQYEPGYVDLAGRYVDVIYMTEQDDLYRHKYRHAV